MDINKDKHKIDSLEVKRISDLEKSFIPDTFKILVDTKELSILDYDEKSVLLDFNSYIDDFTLLIKENNEDKKIEFQVSSSKNEDGVKVFIKNKKELWKKYVGERGNKQDKAVEDMDKYKGVG